MKKVLWALVAASLLAGLAGCGSDKDKGINKPGKHHDLPRAAPKEPGK
jgi:predicted small lipoprotein YifL